MKEFDAEKIIEMSREELFALLGEKSEQELIERLKDGTITYSEFDCICKEAFPIEQQANIVRNAIFMKLTKSEAFNMFESNKEKQQQYAEISILQDKVQKGNINGNELKRLCDIAFGKGSELSIKMQDRLNEFARIKEDKNVEER